MHVAKTTAVHSPVAIDNDINNDINSFTLESSICKRIPVGTEQDLAQKQGKTYINNIFTQNSKICDFGVLFFELTWKILTTIF